MPLGAVIALSWCGEMSLGGILKIISSEYRWALAAGPAWRESRRRHEQALVSLKLKRPVDAGVGRTFAVGIEEG